MVKRNEMRRLEGCTYLDVGRHATTSTTSGCLTQLTIASVLSIGGVAASASSWCARQWLNSVVATVARACSFLWEQDWEPGIESGLHWQRSKGHLLCRPNADLRTIQRSLNDVSSYLHGVV